MNIIIFTQAVFLPCTFQWINDIENDPVYRSWPTGVQELLRATFPGVIRQIRRNFFNLVSSLKHRNAGGIVVMKGMELRAVVIVVHLFWLNWTLWNFLWMPLTLLCQTQIKYFSPHCEVLHFSRYSQTDSHKREYWVCFKYLTLPLIIGTVWDWVCRCIC